jgi:CheY-like chemotaxis protein/two-component sensor histidine kinase
MREVTESQSRFSDIAVNVMELVCEALRMSDEEAVRRADQVRRLVLQLSESEERERRRIADLLHDELQQNLAGVKVHVDMALRHAENDTYLSERLSTANELLREVVEVSRSLSHELRPANIKSRGLIAALGSMASQMEAAHGLTVEISTTGTIPRLSETVEVIVFRSVRELLFNVAKHADVDSATVQLRAEPEGLKLTVRDHGRGFDADAVLESGEGNGLGLISLRERIEAIGGSVSIDSTPGKGSRFTLLVPIPVTGSADRSVSGAADEGYATAESDRREPITVLLVDDHAVIRQGLAMLLNEEPDLSVVAEADSGAHAIEAVRRLRPMVVVMDYTMPGMEGDEATRAIKREFPQTHVIGLSMHAGSDAPERMLEAGADVYLPKTGPSENVIAAIRRVTS